jgi:hypothetical protein
VLVADLANLHDKVKSLSLQVGSPKQNVKDLPPTIFQGLHQMWLCGNFLDESRAKLETQFNHLTSSYQNIQLQVDTISEELSEIQGITTHLESWCTTVNKLLETFHKRFGIIKPLLSRLTITSAGDRKPPVPSHLGFGRKSQDSRKQGSRSWGSRGLQNI